MTKSQKLLISIFGLGLLIAVGLVFWRFKDRPLPVSLPPEQTYQALPPAPTEKTESVVVENVEPSDSAKPLPAEVNLKIPFTSQAPHQNWELPYGEFCEEASALMAASYIKGEALMGPDDADKKLLAVMDFEEKRFGYHEDTTAEETAVILREYFGLKKVALVPNPTALDIRQALAEGKAVIIPAAGRQLGNPNYQQPGPLYHMLVIKGYRKNGDFITNDPGTRRGADYIYKADVLLNALHDWNGGEVETGRKVMIVVG